MFFPAVREVCSDLGLRLCFFGAAQATSPFFVDEGESLIKYGLNWTPQQRLDFDTARRKYLSQNNPRLVFICARWSLYSSNDDAWSPQRLIDHLKNLRLHCGKSLCIFVGQPPELPIGGFDFKDGRIELAHLRVYKEPDRIRLKRQQVHQLLQNFCTTTPGCHFIETEQEFANGSTVRFLDGSDCFYWDDDHLSIAGALRVAPLILTELSHLKY